jgi:hypothetical protein
MNIYNYETVMNIRERDERKQQRQQCECCGRWVNFENIEFNKETESNMCKDCINADRNHQQILYNPTAIFLGKNFKK